MNLFNEIIKKENIIAAYLELNTNLYNKLKSKTYRGIDGVKLNDINFEAEEIIKTCQEELMRNEELRPVNCIQIPKKNGKTRDIYIYSLKDRLKAQAIYRVLEPIFEKTYSPFLFSYRSSHPSYYAARSVARRYLRHYREDYIGVIDISNYSYDMDHEILIAKLKKLPIDNKTLSLIMSFFKIKVYKDKKLYQAEIGTHAGLSLSILLVNLYLNELDYSIGKKVSLYRRVGDDLIMFDKNKTKLYNVFEDAQRQIKELKLKSHPLKSRLISAQENFNFLGYHFDKGVISLPLKNQEKMIDHWSKLFIYNPNNNKTRKLKKILYGRNQYNNFNTNLTQIISQKNLVNNQEQLKKIDQQFIKIITKYFFKKYSPRNQKSLKKPLKNLELPSIKKYYQYIQNGQKNIKSLALSRGKKNKQK
jgi:RNA-directed DNA polymerase